VRSTAAARRGRTFKSITPGHLHVRHRFWQTKHLSTIRTITLLYLKCRKATGQDKPQTSNLSRYSRAEELLRSWAELFARDSQLSGGRALRAARELLVKSITPGPLRLVVSFNLFAMRSLCQYMIYA